MHDEETISTLSQQQIELYIQEFHKDSNSELIKSLLTDAQSNHVPVVSINVAQILKTLVNLSKPSTVLELGTAYGFSTSILKQYSAKDSEIYTIDLVEERQNKAKHFLEKQGIDEKDVHFICADFREDNFLETLCRKISPLDFVFIDAAKGQYSWLLSQIEPFLSENSVIVFDDVFLNGWIINDKYPKHRYKTSFVKMKKFLDDIKKNSNYIVNLLSVDDGLLILSKVKE